MTEENSSWQKVYEAAMLELDPIALHGRIESARNAIRQALEGSACDETPEAVERTRVLTDALGNLETLHRLELQASPPASNQCRPTAEG